MGGFNNPSSLNFVVINLSDLNKLKEGSKITPQDLVAKKVLKILPKKTLVKILGNGNLEKKLTLKGFLYSKSAKEALEKAGCELQA